MDFLRGVYSGFDNGFDETGKGIIFPSLPLEALWGFVNRIGLGFYSKRFSNNNTMSRVLILIIFLHSWTSRLSPPNSNASKEDYYRLQAILCKTGTGNRRNFFLWPSKYTSWYLKLLFYISKIEINNSIHFTHSDRVYYTFTNVHYELISRCSQVSKQNYNNYLLWP